MPLASGAKLGPYEIVAPLGAGGMGEVYRARDTRLGRDVALKILPASISADPMAKQRFEREAKTISGLNHPNICTLHDVGSQDGVDYLVMECVEGETLAKRLEKGPLPLEQVLKYGAQIADALDKAHRNGVVHRDLKPGNIMLTATGAKLLDFGLAKPTAPKVTLATLTMAAPQASPVTQEGTIVGTFQYMSPEQIEGKELDGRSDIFSLGAVLYEMLTGKKAFEGKSHLSVASAILEKQPTPIITTNPLTPPALEHTVKKSLEKLPDERWQSAGDLASELKWIAEAGVTSATRGAVARPGKLRIHLMWATMTLVAIALAVAATYRARRPVPELPLLASVIPPPGVFADTSGRIGPPQISPDGKRIAFIGCKTEFAATSMLGGETCSIWLRVLASSEAREVNGTGGAYYPFWSPDGRELAFFADGKLKKVAADGGPVQVICDAPDARGGSWGNSGTIIFAPARIGPIYRVPAEGGTPVATTRAVRSELAGVISNRWPHFLLDGEHFLYQSTPTGACSELSELHFASLDGKQDVSLARTCSNGVSAPGHLIYWRDGNLVAQPFDPLTGVSSGAPTAIVEHGSFDSLFSIAEFSVSAEGKLVYIAGDAPAGTQLVWCDRNGKVLGTLGEPSHYKNVAISPDGLRVATDVIGGEETKILILEGRGTRTLKTLGRSDGGTPTWSADGREIYFTSAANGPQDIHVMAADGSGDDREVVKFNKGQWGAVFLAVSPDGKHLAYVMFDATSEMTIYTVALSGDHKPQPFFHSPARESAPSFSPDGKWLAYESNRSGRNEVYISPFPAGGARYQVSTSGGERPTWRHDGREIYYREGLIIMAVEVNTKASLIELGTPRPLFELASGNLTGRYYDIAHDGRFLANTSPLTARAQSFSLLVNWPARLKK
jgi:eukaryotic-like serine/threonine-protein kinase